RQEAEAQALEVYGEAPEGAILLASTGWHRGVVGITAARLAERFGVPAMVAALEQGVGHGSARTPEGHDVYAALSACAGELLGFGGHRAAAGFSFSASRLDALRAGLLAAAPRSGFEPAAVQADLTLDRDVFPLPSVEDLSALEPFGEGNPTPLFAIPRARVLRASVVGGDHLKLELEALGRSLPAFGPNMGDRASDLPALVDLVGELRVDHYRGGGRLEVGIVAIQSGGSGR
ncbi:MAG: DHHA1 domain-containing protein, partial [Myxococcales bacterium]|nr:DHHA1 domain-containing protein [Myxococcales bacterium]